MKLKEDYITANCCKPKPDDIIVGYYSHNNLLKVHKVGCGNLDKAPVDRLVKLTWEEILAPAEFEPGSDYTLLEDIDWQIMKHHEKYGVDYSLKIASMLHLDKQQVFDSHTKLRKMALLERVKELMMQYRKGIARNKWIKHRNHTYYKLTSKGESYLRYYRNNQ